MIGRHVDRAGNPSAKKEANMEIKQGKYDLNNYLQKSGSGKAGEAVLLFGYRWLLSVERGRSWAVFCPLGGFRHGRGPATYTECDELS